MNPARTIVALFAFTLIILGSVFYRDLQILLNPEPGPTPELVVVESSKGKLKHGTVVTNHEITGKPHTQVSYEMGKKHGWSYLFYRDGKSVMLAMPYEHGKRQGTSIKYFEDGRMHTETPYDNDKIHGVRKFYFSNGKLMAEVSYAYGYAGTGLKEYTTDGHLKTSYPVLSWKRRGSRVFPEITGHCKDTQFYLGVLFDGRHFNPSEDATLLPLDDEGNPYIDLNTYTPSYLSIRDLICTCTTRQDNPYVIAERIKL
jgi:hypothetical protein